MKTNGLTFHSTLWVAALTMAACSSSKEVTRGDARVHGPQTAQAAATPAGENPDPNAPRPKTRMPEINARAKMLFEDAVKAFEAQKKSRKFDYPSLSRKFKTALDADGQLAEAAYNLGVIAEREGKNDEAISHYRDALRRRPTLKAAAENLAVLAQNTGDTQTAAGIYQDILKVYPDDASSRARLAELYRASGDTERALDFAREALIRDPKTLPAYKVMMKAYLDQRQLALAKLVALRAMKLDETDPELYYTTGLILMQENDPVKARLQLKKAIEVRPDYLPAHTVLAKLALQDGNYQGAEMHLRRILQADGRNAEAHLNLGIAYRGMGQFDKALAEYDTAEKLNPNMPGIFLARGVVLHKGKNAPERGLELYRKYLEMGDVGESGVHKLIQEAEQTLQQAQQLKDAEEEAKRMEAMAKEQERIQKQMEEQDKKAAAGGGGPVAEDDGAPDELPQKDVASAPKEEKPAPKKAAPPPPPEKKPSTDVVPAKGKAPKPSGDEEPSDEPVDNL